MSRTKLVVIFTHRYERNIELLEHVYGDRFEMTILMPFYRGDHPKVARVHDGSYTFQGFFTEGLERYRSDDATHYLFITDDLYLNPRLDAQNVIAELQLSEGTAWIKELHSLAKAPFFWEHLLPAVHTFCRTTGVEYERELPSVEEASALISRHGEFPMEVRLSNLRSFGGKVRLRELRHRHVRKALRHFISPRNRRLRYPLVWGYSDCFVLPSEALDDFAHYCGIFAGMGLWVEVAIPTALALACQRIATEEDAPFRGHEIWAKDEQQSLRDRHDGSIERLNDSFDRDLLYIHPVKLSQWRTG